MATKLSGTFTGTGQSTAVVVFGPFNVSVWGTPLSGGLSGSFSGTVALERSFDGGTTWLPVSTDGTGTAASFTSAISVAGNEPLMNVLYRFDCTAYTSGTINYLLNQLFAGGVGT